LESGFLLDDPLSELESELELELDDPFESELSFFDSPLDGAAPLLLPPLP
jgi:hypothetical protein